MFISIHNYIMLNFEKQTIRLILIWQSQNFWTFFGGHVVVSCLAIYITSSFKVDWQTNIAQKMQKR